MTKKVTMRTIEEFLDEELQSPKFEIAYLNAALADEDQRFFLMALKDVLRARGLSMAILAKESKLNRENLYRIFSERGNPRLKSLRAILKALSMKLSINFKKDKET